MEDPSSHHFCLWKHSLQNLKASLFVVRAFVKLRELLSTHQELASKLAEPERKLEKHDDQIVDIIDAIRELMEPPDDPPRKPIGLHAEPVATPKSRKK